MCHQEERTVDIPSAVIRIVGLRSANPTYGLIEDRKIISLLRLGPLFQPHLALCEVEFEFLTAGRRAAVEGPGFMNDVLD